jgi:hypothetical protein
LEANGKVKVEGKEVGGGRVEVRGKWEERGGRLEVGGKG